MTYTLHFENSMGQRRLVSTLIDPYNDQSRILKMATSAINEFCSEWNFTIYYTRVWNDTEQNETCFDVGSHSEFFYISPAIQSEIDHND